MQSKAATPEEYLAELPEDRKAAFGKLRTVVLKNLPKGFKEVMAYGMLGYVVPHSKYPAGYHCDPEKPLLFISIASQKNFIALYHMGVYADPRLQNWVNSEYPKHSKTRLDMGKSCIRFKKPEQIPFEFIGQLVSKMTPDEWVACYEKNLQQAK